jgi:hypothetical protein
VLNLREPKLIAMTRVFSGAILLGVLFTSCAKIQKKNASCQTDTISVFAAYRMIHHYSDTSVSHAAANIVRRFRLDNICLQGMIGSSEETSFWTGADTVTNAPLMIIETKSSGGSPQWYVIKNPLCPPPTTPPCDTLLSNNDFAAMFPLPPGY